MKMQSNIDQIVSKITKDVHFIKLKNIVENIQGWHDHEDVFSHSVKTANIVKKERAGKFITNQKARALFLKWMAEKKYGMKRQDIAVIIALLHDCGKILAYKEGENTRPLITKYPPQPTQTICPGHEYWGGELVAGAILKKLGFNKELIQYIKSVIKVHDTFGNPYFPAKQNWSLPDIIADAKARARGYYKEAMFNMYCDGYTTSAFTEGRKKIEEIFNEPSYYIERTYFSRMNNVLNVLLSAVKAGGQAAKSVVPSSGIIPKEGRGNFVTAGDLASEKAVFKIIRKNFPSDAILSEETQSSLSNSELLSLNRLWVLDPIDGTNNFRNYRHYSCVSLGLVEKGVILAGAIYDFYHDELFHAVKGKRAYLNSQPISVGTQKDLSYATIATDGSYDPKETRHVLELLLKIDPSPIIGMRGSAALMMCEIASGRTDLYFHPGLKPWDNAAGFLIVEEAGGIIKGLKGEEITFLSPTVVAGNKELVDQFIKRIKEG